MSTPLYRLRIIAGPESGRTFSVGENGALIGRSENCDVVIIDASLSRHHCRMFLRDGLLWIADLKSANSTLVDDVPVQEAPLWKDRRILIGDTVILVESDSGIKHPQTATTPPTSARNPLLLSAAAALVFVASTGLFLWRHATTPTAPLGTTAETTAAPSITHTFLALDYYRIEADDENIRTLHLQLLPPDMATIRVEDLAAKREMRQTVSMPRYQADLLAQRFTESGFFSFTSCPDLETAASEIRISAYVNDRHHTARNTLNGGSASFRNLVHQIEEAANLLFGDWVRDFSDNNLLQIANQKYTHASAVADVLQRDRHNHLYQAIQDLEYAAWLLHPIQPEPSLANRINQLASSYRQSLDDHIRDIFSEADRAARQSDTSTEKEVLQLILARLPDESDLRYRTAARRLATLAQEGEPHDAP
ncbi:MAG: FHA domain-containing protein [Kiritimatiellia bacterium]